ncbi:MAG: sulfotransferase domain-containing protein [bacterium]|nr:sulfotransferase domain-containing protein [bacterium]
MSGASPDSLIVVSHRRSGTHLALDMLRGNLARAAEEPYRNLDRCLPDHAERRDVAWVTRPGRGLVVFKSHSPGELSAFFSGAGGEAGRVNDLVQRSPVVYVYRDGRDVMVSQYEYEKRFDLTVRAMTFSEYLRSEHRLDPGNVAGAQNRPAYWAQHVVSWLDRPNCIPTAFEDWRTRPEEVVDRVASLSGVRRREEFFDARVVRARGSLRRMIQRVRMRWSSRHTSVEFRRGRSGAWRSEFDGDALELFEAHAGRVMDRLGYAKDRTRQLG